MEDQTNGRIYETASPAELGLAGYRGQALIVRRRPAPRGRTAPRGRPGDGPSGAGVPAETLSQVPRHAGPPPPRTEETTP